MEGDAAEVLLPCAICTRTFMPRSLEKHAKICERAAAKKRKPFDSAKQRIQGTDLAEFLPRQEKKRYSNDERYKSSWKETHDDFLRTIRAARSETASMIINQRQSSSHASSGAPMRANEKGTCPTCNRQFGVKAYDRHVAWCKERSTRLPISPATKNIAKERLEARMKYRAPTLKNRRKNNRDKYSQSCTANKTPNRVRETVSVPDNTREKIKENITNSQKTIVTGRGDQSNNGETYNLGESREATKRSIVRPTSSLRSIVPELRTMNPSLDISLKHKREPEIKTSQTDPVQYNTTKSKRIQRANIQIRRLDSKMIEDYYDVSSNISLIDRNEKKNRALTLSGRSVKVDCMITARNQGNSKVNDVTVNENIIGMIVQPCNIYNDIDNGELITWEGMKIDRESNRSNLKDNAVRGISSENCHQLTLSYFQSDDKSSDKDKRDREISQVEDLFIIQEDNNTRGFENDRANNITWSNSIQRLNQTYLIKESDDHEIVNKDIFHDSNRSNDSIDINDNKIVRSISAREDHYENDHGKIEINYEIQSDHDTTSNYSLPETKSEIYAIEKYDKNQENSNNSNNNKSEEVCYINSVIENNMIDNIVPLSSSSDIGTIVNETYDSPESIIINGNIVTLVQEKKEEEGNNSSFVDSTNKNASSYSRGSIVRTDTKSEELHSVYETSTNASEQEEVEEEEEEEEIEEEEEEEDMEKNMDEKKLKMIDCKDRKNDLKRFPSINSKTHRIRSIKINSKIQENLNLLRGSTDTLISSVEAIDYVNNKRSNRANSTYEEDNIDRSHRIENRYDKYELLPEIKRDISTEKNSQIFDQNYYWKKTLKFSNDRSINDLMSHNYRQNRLHKRNPKIRILPPILIDSSSPRIQRTSNSSNRPLWSNYMRRRPDFNLVLRCRIGACKEYDPFLIAERQMQDLLSDSSDLSLTEIPSSSSTKSLLPLSHSSAFIKYPYQTKTNLLEKSITNEFDELTSDFSSDSTETNSLSREIFLKDFHDSKKNDRTKKISNRELGRRMIIDRSLALGKEIDQDKSNSIDKQYKNDIFNKGISKSMPNRSQTIRAFSAPKSIYQRKNKTVNTKDNNNQEAKYNDNNVRNDYLTFSNSDLSLSSIVSSEIDLKRSNSVFDQLITSFEDDIVGNDSFPSLRSLLRNESLRASSNGPPPPDNNRQFDGHISDEEFSSAENYKQQEHKINADSAYSSLNRKYSNHGRSSNNDTTNRMEDNMSRSNRRESQPPVSKAKCRMSRFCHECGSRFPETAKFCCQCGVKRLAL